ncbi:MAG: hypothetical protein M3680_36905 [Myxococcota bacterium]|nr:hypothetical protein [Myxococcota bacterium]
MKGDIALAGFMMTAQEWHALDAASRALLLELAAEPEEQQPETDDHGGEHVIAPALAVGSAPVGDERAAS